MRATVVLSDRSLGVVEIPHRDLPLGHVRIKVSYCGICGSDLHMRLAESIPAGSPVGVVLGHEFVGTVLEVAPDVTTWTLGDRVAGWPSGSCGDCAICRSGKLQLCRSKMTDGIGLGKNQGALAESVVVKADRLFALPDGLSDEHAALTEPLAVALRAIGVGAVQPLDRVAVIGAGPVGLITALALRAKGINTVVLIEVNAKRAKRAEAFGFTTIGPDGTGTAASDALGGAPSVVMECAGHQSALPLAMNIVGPGGTVVVLGVLEEPVMISQLLIIGKELRILGSFGHTPEVFASAIELLASGAIPADDLVTGYMVLEDADRAFNELMDPNTSHIKILLHP